MSHTNGIIYKPIDVRGDISAVLGRVTGDVGQLCADVDGNGDDVGAIRFWSLKKPIRHYKIGELTEAEWKAANYGYTINDYTKPVNEGNSGLIYDHINNRSWLYLKPRGAANNEWFRVTDFHGYDSGATNPFEVSYSATPTIGQSARIDILFLDNLLEWGRFASFGPTYANLYLGLIAYPASSPNPQSCYLLPVTSSQSGLTILDIAGNERFTYPVPSNIFSSGTAYKLRPVIMTYDAGSNYGTWQAVNTQSTFVGSFYDIPCEEITVTPSQAVTPDENVSIYVDSDNATYSGESPMTITAVPIYITNSNSVQITECVLYVYFKDYQYTAQGQTRELGHTSSFNVNANTSNVLKTVTGNLTITPLTSMAQGTYEFSFKVGNTLYTKSGNFTIGEK